MEKLSIDVYIRGIKELTATEDLIVDTNTHKELETYFRKLFMGIGRHLWAITRNNVTFQHKKYQAGDIVLVFRLSMLGSMKFIDCIYNADYTTKLLTGEAVKKNIEKILMKSGIVDFSSILVRVR